MYYGKILVLIGAVIFLLSGFLPLISAYGASASLMDAYTGGGFNLNTQSIGLLLAMIFFPLAAAFGFIGFWKGKIALAAGVLGLLCWIGAIIFLASVTNGLSVMGAGIFVGFAGAIILIIGGILKPPTQMQGYPQPTYTPPPTYAPPPQQQQPYQQPYQQTYQQPYRKTCPRCGVTVDPNQRFCPNCGNPLT
jgi:hypothetical protein